MSNIIFTGTTQGICFYLMRGQLYARAVSSLTGKRVKKDKKFALTMVYAGLMARASRIGSAVYKALPEGFREYWMYRAFTGEALTWLKQGKDDKEAREILMKTYVSVWEKKEEDNVDTTDQNIITITPKGKLKGEILLSHVALTRYCRDKACLVSVSDDSIRRYAVHSHSPPGSIFVRLVA